MDPLSKFLNRLIERVHPWHRVRFEWFDLFEDGVDTVTVQIGSVYAKIDWNYRESVWQLHHAGTDAAGDAFIQRIRDIMAGKNRDDAGNMIDKP